MRVLLSGASGFVGANVLDYMLLHTDWEFVAPCSWRHKGNSQRLGRVLNTFSRQERVEVLSMDLSHPIPNLGDFDYIVNIASESNVDRSIISPVSFIENNVSVALQMLEYARLHPCEKFIQFSTDEVFGPDGEGPSSPYAASKAAQESIAAAYRRTYSVDVITVNSSNVIGPMQDIEKFVPRIIKAVRSGDTIKIHHHHGVIGARYYDIVANVSSALVHLLQYKLLLTRYQLGSDAVELDNLNMAQSIADIIGKPLRYEMTEVESIRPGYDQHYHWNGNPIEGWKPVIAFQDGLINTVNAPILRSVQ